MVPEMPWTIPSILQPMGNPPIPQTNMQTEILPASPDGIARAANLLGAGKLVAFPTETVYGLGADARSASAVAGIYRAKGRPTFNPLIVHVSDLGTARALACFHEDALRLAAAFWPGPMTLVLPARSASGLSQAVGAGLNTIGLRVPDHPVARSLLEAFGGPVAAPSANRSGRISPTTIGHVLDGLSGRVDALVDGGMCPLGLESTIIGFCNGPVVLRPGGLTAEAVEARLGKALELQNRVNDANPDAPGQLSSHYAPRAKLRLNATDRRSGEVLLGFGPAQGADLNLSPVGDLTEAAANLFACLHRLDGRRTGTIAVSPIPESGLGQAINDRLRRAAARG